MKSTMDNQQSIEICGMVKSLLDRTIYILKDILQNEQFEMLRLRTKNNEIIITKDEDIVFVVFQCVTD
jgi:hypothetical protein